MPRVVVVVSYGPVTNNSLTHFTHVSDKVTPGPERRGETRSQRVDMMFPPETLRVSPERFGVTGVYVLHFSSR